MIIPQDKRKKNKDIVVFIFVLPVVEAWCVLLIKTYVLVLNLP